MGILGIDTMKAKAICNIYVGEHVENVAKGLCGFLTNCLVNKMLADKFSDLWDSFLDGDDRNDILGYTIVDGEKEYWEDNLEFEEDLDFIYKKALNHKADCFITFNNNAYIDIVAIRGHPKPKDIALLVLGSKENVGDWTDEDTIDFIGEEYLNET